MDKFERISEINVRCTEAADLISLALDELDSGAEYLSKHAVEALNKLEAEELKKNGGAAV